MGANEVTTAHKPKKIDGETAVMQEIAGWSEQNRAAGKRLHALIKAAAPQLAPRLWYGMPAYADEGKVVCFFRGTDKYKERYMTFGFEQIARLDDGNMWPIAFAITELTPAEEERITRLVQKAMG